jgi:hypothetical protein
VVVAAVAEAAEVAEAAVSKHLSKPALNPEPRGQKRHRQLLNSEVEEAEALEAGEDAVRAFLPASTPSKSRPAARTLRQHYAFRKTREYRSPMLTAQNGLTL